MSEKEHIASNDSVPQLDRYLGAAKLLCSVCEHKAGWLIHSDEAFLPVCDECAATLLFSDPARMASLISHLKPDERNQVLLSLWNAKKAS